MNVLIFKLLVGVTENTNVSETYYKYMIHWRVQYLAL